MTARSSARSPGAAPGPAPSRFRNSRLTVALALVLSSGLLTIAAAPVQAAEFDPGAAEFAPVREGYERETNTVALARLRALREMLTEAAAAAEADYQERLQARNVKGMAVARKAQELAQRALADLDRQATFELPADLRRELLEWRNGLVARQAGVEAQATQSLARVRAKYADGLAGILIAKGQPAPSPEEAAALLERILGFVPAPAPPSPPTEEPTAPSSPAPSPIQPADDWTAARRASLPDAETADVFASNAAAAAWVPAGTWTGAMVALDVINIPILNTSTSVHGRKENPVAGGASEWTYQPAMPLEAEYGRTYAFRLRRLAGHRSVDVLEWPSLSNRGRLVVRTQMVRETPSIHGFVLETAAPAASAAAAPTLEIPVTTQPSGASILVNGIPVQDGSGHPLETPTTLRLRPGKYTIRLVLRDHVSKEVGDWVASPGRSIAWSFTPQLALPSKSVRVDPGKAWSPTELAVNAGDRVWFIPSGKWSCGSRKERCGPEGYPETDKFAHYSGDANFGLRQVETEPYGALLVRVGPHAPPVVLATTTAVEAASSGFIYFDVNESPAPERRKDNQGTLDVKVIHVPAGLLR